MKILVATDFGETARHATDLAITLAKRLGDEVKLCYVVEPTMVTSPDFMVDVEAIDRAVEDKAKTRMKDEQKRVSASDFAIETRVERGQIGEVISRLGKEANVRLIVAGTHGARPLERLFLGSGAERIVLQSERPVLIVRKPGDGVAPTIGKAGRPLRLVVGIEPSRTSAHAVNWVRELRATVPCEVTFVHFYWPPEQINRLGFQGTGNLTDPDPTTVGVLEREMRTFVGDFPGENPVRFKIVPHWGDLGNHLAQFASELDADMLVLGTHQKHTLKRMWLGATTQPVLRASSVPVLCVPTPPEEAAPPVATRRMKTVMAVTDFSVLADTAIPYAYGMVAPGGTVILAHVHERHLPNPQFAYVDTRGAIAGTEVEGDLKKKLMALVPKDAEALDVKTKAEVIDGGYPATAIVQSANRLGVDAICIASHGRTGIGKAILGSVASAVVKGADRPVFVVRGAWRP